MKYGSGFCILLIICISTLTACGQKTDYATDGPFIVATHASAGPDDYRNMFPSIYTIDLDGNLTLSTESSGDLILGENVPVFETKLDEEEIQHIQELIEENKFWDMPEDVEDINVQDGGSQTVTVHVTDASKTVGGLNPNHEGFLEISSYIFSLVDSEDYRTWHEDTTDHIFELNP